MLASFASLQALIRSVLGPLFRQKVNQPRINLPKKQTLQLVQLSFANVNIVKAIFGWASTVAEVIGKDTTMLNPVCDHHTISSIQLLTPLCAAAGCKLCGAIDQERLLGLARE
jgi:hypothetical protein